MQARNVAKDAAGAVLCGIGGLNRATNDITGKVNPLYRGSPLDRFRDRVSDALNGFCPAPGGALPPPPFQPEGGQCVGVRYSVSGRARRFNTTPPTPPEPIDSDFGPIQFNIFGPVTPYVEDQVAGFRYGNIDNSQRFNNVIVSSATANNGQDFYPPQFLSFSAVRLDGNPDECGDPPPIVPPGTPPPTDPRPPGTVININLPGIGPVDVTFSPTVGIVYADIDAEIKVPVKVDVDIDGVDIDIDFDFEVNLTDPTKDPVPVVPAPDVDDDGRPVIPDCPEPGQCEEPPQVSPPEVEEPDEVAAKGLELLSVTVLSVRTGQPIRQTELSLGGGRSLFVPYIALVNIVYEAESGSDLVSNDIVVKTTRAVIPVPKTGLKAKTATARWETGWEGEIFLNRIAPASCK